jgi:hypothetical protein
MTTNLTLRAGAAGLLAVLLAVTSAHAVRDRSQENQGNFEPEEAFKELKVPPPAYPEDRNLIQFPVTPASRNRFSVDGSTLSVGEDKVIRFILVIDTPEKARNVSFAGLRCKTREWKDYAFGERDRTWRVDETREWRLIHDVNQNNYQYTLFKQFLCYGGVMSGGPAGKPETLVRNLKYPPVPDNRSPRRYNDKGANY